MAGADFKDLNIRAIADEALRDQVYDIANNPKCDGYHRGVASMVYKFFNKKNSGELYKGLYKPIIRKFEKRKVTHFL